MAEQDVQPTLPDSEPEPAQAGEEDQITAMIEQLKGAGVSTSDDLAGKLRASQEVGNMARVLGEVREQNARLTDYIKNMQQQPQPQRFDQEYMDNPGQPIDIEQAIKRASKEATKESLKELREEERREQLETQRVFAEKWDRIRSDKHYNLVKDIVDEKAKDPQFMYQIQSGQIDPEMAYKEIVIDFVTGLAVKQTEAFKKAQEGGGPVAAPHTETQDTITAPNAASVDDNAERIKAAVDKVEKGGKLSENEELDLLTAVLQGQG